MDFYIHYFDCLVRNPNLPLFVKNEVCKDLRKI
jgi:hypothetical protein